MNGLNRPKMERPRQESAQKLIEILSHGNAIDLHNKYLSAS